MTINKTITVQDPKSIYMQSKIGLTCLFYQLNNIISTQLTIQLNNLLNLL